VLSLPSSELSGSSSSLLLPDGRWAGESADELLSDSLASSDDELSSSEGGRRMEGGKKA
jgi:hypothetical protein